MRVKREVPIHAFGGLLLVISSLSWGVNIIPVLVGISVLFVSLGVRWKNDYPVLAGLLLVSFAYPYIPGTLNIGQIFHVSRALFITVFPLIIYWVLVLDKTLYPNKKAIAISSSFFAASLMSFYILILSLGLQEYLLSPENIGPQILFLSACTLSVFLPFHIMIKHYQ